MGAGSNLRPFLWGGAERFKAREGSGAGSARIDERQAKRLIALPPAGKRVLRSGIFGMFRMKGQEGSIGSPRLREG